MIRQLIKDSKSFLIQKPKLIKLAFWVWFSRSISILLLLAYNINNVLIYRFWKWLSIFTLFQYFIDEITANHIIWLIIILIIFVALWYVFLYPMWIAAMIHFLNKKKENISGAIGKWANDFFSMFELNALAFSFGPYTYMVTILRLITLDVLESWFIIWLLILWWIIVLFSSIFWQYAKFIIIDEQIWVFDAIKKSIWLTITNMWITIKWLIMKITVLLFFYIKMVIVVWVPLLLMYFLITTNIINDNNERIIRTIWIISIILASYIIAITQAFFMTFWHKIYRQILEKSEKEKDSYEDE